MAKGRPPVTRARVLNYIEKHQPATVMQIARVMKIDRAQVYRILRAAYGPDFRSQWPGGAESDDPATQLPCAA